MSLALSRMWSGRLAGGLIGLALAVGAPTAVAETNKGNGSTGGKKPPGKVTFVEAPSSEKPAAREKRLRRECKGRPNAGMCLGYTR